MASKAPSSSEITGELLIAWQKYIASGSDEITLKEGDVVELLETVDPDAPSAKKAKLDPGLDEVKGEVLDSSAARHKLSLKPKRTHASSRHSPTRLNLNARWLVREVSGARKQGWVPCKVLQTLDDPNPGGPGLPGDALFRRQAVVKELVETEQEFVRDLDHVVQSYLTLAETGKVPKIVRDNFEIIFSNLKEIAEFHRTVLMEGVKYYANEPHLLGKAFLRLERDFDKHVSYYIDEPQAQNFLDTCDEAHDYFDELSQRLGDDKTITEHLKLPIQRINDYQLLLKELVRYSSCLGEDSTDLQKALELMLSVPHRAQDDKFTSSIEGYRGSIHKLGRLLAHDWFSVTFGEVIKERYLFLFKGRVLICKVRRISEDRSVFQLKDIIKLTQVVVKDHSDKDRVFELIDKNGGQSLTLTAHRDHIKDYWLKEIKEFAQNFGEEDTEADEFRIASPPTEAAKPEPPKQEKPVSKKPEQQAKSTPEPPKPEPAKQVPPKPEPPKEQPPKPPKQEPPKPEPPKQVPPKLELPKPEPPKPAPPKPETKKSEIKPKETKTQNPTKTVDSPQSNPAGPKKPESNPSTETLKGAETPKNPVESPKVSEQDEAHHLSRIKAVEPLVHINPKRRLEEKVPYNLKEEVQGSALQKVYSVESVENRSEVLASDFSVGLEVTYETGDMSRKYTSSSARAEGLLESSYNRRGTQSNDGLSSSRYESASSRYGTDSSLTGGSKYESKYESKYDSPPALGGSKYETSSLGGSKYEISSSLGGSKYETSSSLGGSKYETSSLGGSKYETSSSLGGSKYETSSSLGASKYESLSSKYGGDSALSLPSRRSITGNGDNDYSKKSPRLTDDDTDAYSYSSRRLKLDNDDYSPSKRSKEGEGESYSTYSRRSNRLASLEVNDGDDYKKRTVRTSIEGVGDADSYSVKKSFKTSLEGSNSALEDANYGKRSSSTEQSDILSKYSRRSASGVGDVDEDLVAKYLKYKPDEEEEDKYAKYRRKYSRTEASEEKKEEEYKPKYTRKSSTKKGEEEEEDDPYARYANKYLRTDSKENKSDNSESYSTRKKLSTDLDTSEKESTSITESTVINGKEVTSVATERHSVETSTVTKEGKSATEKLEEMEEVDDRPRFIKTIRGTNIEPGETAHFEVALNEKPVNFQWLKDNQPINSNASMSGRIQTSSPESREFKLLLKEARIEDSGTYTAIATSETGKASCSAQLIVHELTLAERKDREESDKPEFLVQMKDTELLEETYLRFMVKVRGEPNPEITFFKDGVKIPDNVPRYQIIREHSDKGFYELVIPEVKKDDAGIYKCVATNKYGESSSEATVTVTDNKKVFEEMPEGEILPPGEKPSFTWKKDGVAFEPEERFKVLMGDDEDSLALVFQHVRPDDIGLYTCVAQTSRGHISCSAELTVHGTVNQLFREPEKPSLIIEKKDPIVQAGGSAMIELQVKGYPKPTVKFCHQGKAIEASSKYKFLYEDEESMSLVIKNVEESDAGKYQIIAENDLGSETAEVTLTVKKPPKVKAKVENVDVHADLLLRIPVEIEGIPKPSVLFYKDGQEVKKSERIKIVEEGEKHVLVIEKTSLKDTGSYSVVATNELAQVSDFWKVDIHSKPKIIEKLGKDKVVSQSENLELKIKMEAEPKPEVKWYKDNVEITEDGHYFIRNDGDSYILKISGAVTTDAAKYKVKAVNIHGEVEDEVKVDVKKAPKIIEGLKDMVVKEHDQNITFDVKLEAFPKPTVKWYLDEMEITETRSEFTRIESDDGAKLVINEVTSELSGRYTCKLSNECGAAETSAKLTVHCVPRIIKHLKDTTVDEGATLDLEIEVEGCPSPTVKWLRNGREVSADARIKITRDTQRYETFHLAVNLIKYEEQGEYEVIVTNTMGTVSSKSNVTVHKVIHTDAIEETEEPPRRLRFETVEDEEEPQVGKIAEKEEKEELEPEPPSQPEITEVEKPKERKGSLVERLQIEERLQQISEAQQTPEPIVEEPPSPLRGQPAIIEESEEIEADESATPRSYQEEEVPKPKSRRGKSVQIEEIEEVEEIIEEPQTLVESDLDTNKKLKRGISAQKVEVEIVDNDELTKSSQKAQKGKVQQEESQKGVKDGAEEDTELDDLLNRAKRQRSLVEEFTFKDEAEVPSKGQAVPTILDTNMKDGSRPESLDITYIVRGTANPPPTAKWTLDGKEIKPDGHLRMSTAQDGEEFRLEIKKLEMKDAGVYECTLTNLLGDVKQRAVLEVTPEQELRRPKLKEGLQDQTIVKKNSVTFRAVVIGDPIPDITWCLNGKRISNDDFEEFKIILETEDHEIEDGLKECSYSLTIPRCERCNGGNYTLQAKNKWGELESSAVLTIILRPEIEGPETVSVVPGEPAQFTVIIQSNPVPEITWSKDDKVIVPTEFIEIVKDVENETYKLIFNKTLLSDEGYYKVTAKNHLGETSSEARLKAIKDTEPTSEVPRFITGLNDEQVEHTGEISVMVRADGLPKPEIKWFFNGKPIVEDEKHQIVTETGTQVTSSLTIKDYQDSDIGLYKATAVNVVGEADTSSRISMLQTPPSFAKKLDRSAEVNEGEPLELKAKVNGSPKPKVQWFKDGEPIPVDDERVQTTLLPDGTVKLNIDSCKPEDSGAYRLLIRNPNGDNVCLCAVAVTQRPQRPKFLKCFKDCHVPIGETLRLEAKIMAYPPPEIKWMKDGLPVRLTPNIHTERHPDGTVALMVDYARPENAGKYELIVVNKLGETSGDAKVDVEKKPTKPEFVTKLQPQTVVEGFPVKFEVKADGYPTPKITWKRNGAEIISDNKHVKITNLPDGTSILILDAADVARDSLTYTATATNNVGESDTNAPLTVTPANNQEQPEERPMFLHALKDVITDEGQPLILKAPFSGNPIPSVEWTKDGEPIKADDRILMTCDGKKVGLTIDSALPSDAGVYGVTITNPLGKESSEAKGIVHKVFMPPTFLQKFTDLQQLPDRDAKFPCRVSGVPQPEVTWSKDGIPIKESDKYHIKRDGDACCLYVLNCQPEDAGVYRATATNKEGQDVCTATLEVVKEIKSPQKIEAPVFLKRIGDTELFKGMTAKFTACATGIPEPNVEWFHNDQKIFPSSRIRMETDRAGLLRLTIAGVDQDDLGKYTCKISNEHGSDICHANLNIDGGIESKPKRPITDQYTEFDKYKRSGAPMPLSDPPIISQMTDRHCTLSWKPSIPSAPRAPVTYQLEMCELPHGDWFMVRSGIRSCTCGVRNLEPFRDYKFRVRVENKYGISDPSPYAITHREKLEPDLPKFRPYLPPEIDFRPETSPYFPKDFDIERPPHDNMAQAPRFLRQEHDTQYGVKDQNTNLFWFVYGYPKPKVSFYFNDELIEGGGRFDSSYTRNGQATLFINKMLDRDVGWYEAVARNEHGEARQRVRLEIAELPTFLRRPEIEYTMLRGKGRFEARIVGVPYPEIKWYKDWKPLAFSARIKIQFVEPDTHILVINDVISKDEALYSVSARNVAGSASSSAMLYVDENDLEHNWHTYSSHTPIKLKKKPHDEYYDIGDELGRGTQGITYHAVERINGRNYAAKIMHGRGDLRPFMYNEYDMMQHLRHRKLVSLHDAYETDDTLALILELGAGGELVRDYLLKQDYYTETDIAGFIRQTLQGLQFMHERGYGHMGLNLGDLLISHPGGDDLKICDFGLTRKVTMGKLYPLNYGLPEYVSPECANGEGTGLAHDMWSVGIMTYILLSGRSPFRGADDRETLRNIQAGKWEFDESWWLSISSEARDFISKLLVYQSEGRLDVHSALRHPWLERADKIYTDDFRISTRYLSDYWRLYREWYDNASCKRWLRRRPLEGAFTHPSRMVYPPGDDYSPRPTPVPDKTPRKLPNWEDQLPTRSPLNYEIGMIQSESHYQNGPDTYLLQLRDVSFPVRLREYMKVAGSRGLVVSDENGYDWSTPTIRERRRFTDVMDEEIDDERKARINRYGADSGSSSIRRLRHELGNRLDTYVEAEAFLESKQEGRLPFFREKPQTVAMVEGKDLLLTCMAVGEPQPIVQWFKNDSIVAESHRIKITTDESGRSYYKLSPALSFDQGMYKVVARNKIGQTFARARIVVGMVPDEPDSPEASQISDTEVLLTWKQPKNDGNSTVLCYKLEYKLADDMEWTKKADNIDHEFYLLSGLQPERNYIFRLAARNAIGWSEQGVPTAAVQTKSSGAAKIQLSPALSHLQQITDSGKEVEEEAKVHPDYSVESKPVDWQNENFNDNFKIISEISKGRFSAVLKAIDKRSDEVVVAKVLQLDGRTEDVEGEFAALRSLRHERIASLTAAYKTGDLAVFILEKLQGADVLTFLASKHEYSEQIVAQIVSQILDGLQYLHWRGLCHLDLQPDNIVMCTIRSVQIKLVDFGNAHRVTKLGTKVPVVGHPDYISPEVLADEPAYPQSDIWSVGALTYMMLSGVVPFRGQDEQETRQNILFVRYRFEHLYKELSQEATRFIMLLFKRHPNKRPTAEECHENRWLMPTDYMIKKRERAIFLGNRLKEYSEEYHKEKSQSAQDIASKLGAKFSRSHSIQEELLTAP